MKSNSNDDRVVVFSSASVDQEADNGSKHKRNDAFSDHLFADYSAELMAVLFSAIVVQDLEGLLHPVNLEVGDGSEHQAQPS